MRIILICTPATLISDTVTNILRVVEVYKLTSTVPITYRESFLKIKEKEGLYNLMVRGLKTRITANLI